MWNVLFGLATCTNSPAFTFHCYLIIYSTNRPRFSFFRYDRTNSVLQPGFIPRPYDFAGGGGSDSGIPSRIRDICQAAFPCNIRTIHTHTLYYYNTVLSPGHTRLTVHTRWLMAPSGVPAARRVGGLHETARAADENIGKISDRRRRYYFL